MCIVVCGIAQKKMEDNKIIITQDDFDSPRKWIAWLEKQGRPLDTERVIWTTIPKGKLEQYKKEHPNARITSATIVGKEKIE